MSVTLPHWIRTKNGVAFSDVPTQTGGRLPNFLIIGAAKAGTTSIFRYLGQHPQIHTCLLKEPHFFSTDQIYEYGFDWYKGLYADAKIDQICGEASTSYSMWPKTASTPQRIYDVVPDVKLIYIIREPIARIESECLQIFKYSRYVLGDQSLPSSVDALLEYMTDEKNGVGIHPIHNSEYIRQINQYLRLFKRDQLLILFQEDLQHQPGETLSKTFEFLGVDKDFKIDLAQKHNVTQNFTQGLKVEKFTDSLRKVPGYGLIKRLLPASSKEAVKSFATSKIIKEDAVQSMSDETRNRLAEHFRPLNNELADFLHRDISHWNL